MSPWTGSVLKEMKNGQLQETSEDQDPCGWDMTRGWRGSREWLPGLCLDNWRNNDWCWLSVNYAAAAAKSPQSCPTLCDPIDGSPPGSAVPGIFQSRTLEWVAIAFSKCQLWARQYGATARYENCPVWKWWIQDSNSHQLGLEFMLLDGDREKQWV